MAKIQGKQLVSPIILSGSFSGSFEGDGSNLTGISGGNIETGSFATTGSNIFIGDQIVTGSVNISGSLDVIAGITGSLFGTASFATNALTASFAISASHEIIKEVSSSHADTASFAGNLFGTPSIVVSNITASNISASGDLSIEGFPSVSASLAAATGSIPTLQQVTDQGSSTTTAITASIISASGDIIAKDASFKDSITIREGIGTGIIFSNNNDKVYFDGGSIVISVDDSDNYLFGPSGLDLQGHLTSSGT